MYKALWYFYGECQYRYLIFLNKIYIFFSEHISIMVYDTIVEMESHIRKKDLCMDFLIRKMQNEDWEDVKRIYIQSLVEGRSTFETRCPSYEEWNNNHILNCRYVAVTGDKVIGWVAISPTSSREAYKGVVGHSIYVDHDYHHRGIGKALLKHLCNAIEQHGYWCLYTTIFAINEASIHLHKSCGFRVIGTREKIAKDRFGQWQDTVAVEHRNNIF